MAFQPNQPYNDLPRLPPAHDLESVRVMRHCITASRALAELKGAGNLIPNQSILINAIPLQEAKASSEIENIVTTQDALFSAGVEQPGLIDPQTKEVLRYRTALRHGYEVLQNGPLNLDLIIEICSSLRDGSAGLRDQESIIIEDAAAQSVLYTPPRGRNLILSLLRNLESYLLESGGVDPLIKMAVAHYQFEAIHPFDDGNGRTGRILNILALIQAGLLDIPVLYLSRFIINNKQKYYTTLGAVTEDSDWENWLLFMLTAVEESAHWTTGRILAIRDLLEDTLARCRKELPAGVYSKELIELIFVQPYCKISFVVEAGIAKRQTASKYLRELERIGIIVSEKRGRMIIYRNLALLELLAA
jgi:Fic family protein